MKIEAFLKASPIYLISHANQSLCATFTKKLRDEQVNILQSLVLLAIFFERGHPVSPSQLARSFASTMTNVSHSLSHLERLKLIHRELNPKDSRSYLITLRPEGKRSALRLIRIYHRAQEAFEKQIGSRALQQALAALASLKLEK